jgi:tRNA(Ser,Leu) C12 N-acetylase TAN1
MDAVREAGATAIVTFEDPDVVVDVETVGGWAGIALRTRDDRSAFRFLQT